jgi:hypothetical protein
LPTRSVSAAFAGLTYAAATEPAKTPSAARRVIFECRIIIEPIIPLLAGILGETAKKCY